MSASLYIYIHNLAFNKNKTYFLILFIVIIINVHRKWLGFYFDSTFCIEHQMRPTPALHTSRDHIVHAGWHKNILLYQEKGRKKSSNIDAHVQNIYSVGGFELFSPHPFKWHHISSSINQSILYIQYMGCMLCIMW